MQKTRDVCHFRVVGKNTNFFGVWGSWGGLGGVVAQKVSDKSDKGQTVSRHFFEKAWFSLIKFMFLEGAQGEPRRPRHGHNTDWGEDRRVPGLPGGGLRGYK